MRVLDHNGQALEEWRPGVKTRMRISALSGSVQLCVFEQWCDPGKGAPTHLHAVEEVLTVMEGTADVWVEDETVSVSAGQSVVVPAGRKHGFRNSGTGTLHVMATLASPMFEASFDAAGEVSRRWVPSAETAQA